MSDIIINSPLTALKAYVIQLNNTANNITNLKAECPVPVQTALQAGSSGNLAARPVGAEYVDNVDLSREVVDMILLENGFKASIKALKTAQEVQKSIIDIVV